MRAQQQQQQQQQQPTKELQAMKAILGQIIKCTLDDGRIATGKFVCMDRLQNLILTNVLEERWIDSSDYSTKTNLRVVARRDLSQAMIPGIHLVRIEIASSIYNQKMIPILTTTTTTSSSSSSSQQQQQQSKEEEEKHHKEEETIQ